jgi:type I restriction enzyme S subunit
VAHLVTGAVQPKISMGNLKKLELCIPADASTIDQFTTVLAGTTRALFDQNQLLARTRDELLPLLMSGKVSVRDAQAVAGEAL